MCYRCEGLTRKPIDTPEDFEIYSGRVPGKSWPQIELQEVSACSKKRLEEGLAERLTEAPDDDNSII